jgi:hypothetical protein
MDTMIGKNNSVCLVLIEELTQFKIIEPLKAKKQNKKNKKKKKLHMQ